MYLYICVYIRRTPCGSSRRVRLVVSIVTRGRSARAQGMDSRAQGMDSRAQRVCEYIYIYIYVYIYISFGREMSFLKECIISMYLGEEFVDEGEDILVEGYYIS